MKTTLTLLAITLFSAASSLSKVEWHEGTSKDTQLSESQEKARIVFSFTNGGKAPLSVAAVRASCGCTVPEYPKNIIMPASKGDITLEYHAKPPGRGRTVSAQVEFSDGTSASLSWRVVSANSPQDRPQIPLVSWSSGDMSEQSVTIEIPPGHEVLETISPPEVKAVAGPPSDGKVEVKISRLSERPFWGALRLRTTPPIEDHRTRINVRASP